MNITKNENKECKNLVEILWCANHLILLKETYEGRSTTENRNHALSFNEMLGRRVMNTGTQTDQAIHTPPSKVEAAQYFDGEDNNQDYAQEPSDADIEKAGIIFDAEALENCPILSLDFLNELDSANAGMSSEESKVLSSIDQLLEGLEEQRRAMVAKLHASKVCQNESITRNAEKKFSFVALANHANDHL